MSLPEDSSLRINIKIEPASLYYGPDRDPRKDPKTRTLSTVRLLPICS